MPAATAAGNKGTAGTKGVARPEREAQILDIATDLFGRHGYAGVSVATVAAAAGISKPLIHTYFASKSGLFIACVERVGNELAAAIEAVLAGSDADLSMATATLRAIFTTLEKRPHGWNVVFDRTVPEDSEAAAAARAVIDRIQGQGARGVATVLTAAGLRDPLDASALTRVWISSVTALVNWWLEHPDQTAEQMTQRSARLVAAISAPG